MATIKPTINELKRQKDALNRYERYLPTLLLKKQYLQIERTRIQFLLKEKAHERETLLRALHDWDAVLGEEVGLPELLQIEVIDTEQGNIAGVDMPVYRGIQFKEVRYDLYTTPLWVDAALQELRKLLTLEAEMQILQAQRSRLEDELVTTTQRVNLFEKVKIPETRNTIRTIQIFLGDQQIAAVIRSKIAKKKTERQFVIAEQPLEAAE
jgi:V/A-type H+-transporting ATPase subunit D